MPVNLSTLGMETERTYTNLAIQSQHQGHRIIKKPQMEKTIKINHLNNKMRIRHKQITKIS